MKATTMKTVYSKNIRVLDVATKPTKNKKTNIRPTISFEAERFR